MKKYLIKGLLALFVGSFAASCTDHDVEYVPIAQQKTQAYNAAFKELIGGEVAPDHDWGFTQSPLFDEDEIAAIRAMTRATGEFANHVGAYPDANMWTSKGFLAPDPLTHAQKLRAQYYFQMNQITNPNRPDNGTKDFFMQQVYDGGTDPMAGKSLEKYLSADNSTYIESGEHMDHLTCGPDHTHTFNFNNGNCSTNSNVADRDQTDVNNTAQQHSDEIQLMLNTKTSCFGYANSDASYVRDDRWTLVSATTIDNFCDNDPGFASWLASKLNAGEVDKKCDDEFHRSFIGFDFDQLPDILVYTGTENWEYGKPEYNYQPHLVSKTYSESDYYRYDLYGNKYHYLKSEQNQYCGQFQNIDPEPNEADAKDLLDAGWLPVINSANKKWVKVGGCADGYYSDWIVTFMPASSTPSGGGQSSSSTTNRTDRMERHKLIAQGRIFCEDLGTTIVTKSDIDFNDAVFDAKIWRLGQYDLSYVNGQCVTPNRNYIQGTYTNGIDAYGNEVGTYKYVAEILLLAAGGTVPLKIGGTCDGNFEIHDKFGTGNNRNIAHTTIINTVGEPSRQYFTTTVATDVCNAVKVEVDITSLVKAKIKADLDAGIALENIGVGLDIIPIEVQWVSQEGEAVKEINADYGQVPQKLCVDLGTRWVYERVPIIIIEDGQTSGPYRDFDSYAKTKNPEFWKTDNIDWDLLYPNIPEGMTASVDYDEVKIPGTTTTTTTTELIVWEGEQVYASSTSQYSITLYNTTFAAGNKLRIYGSSGSGEITINDSNSQVIIQRNLDFSQSGYVDITLDETQATKLSNGPSLLITGANFTITKLAKVVTTVQ